LRKVDANDFGPAVATIGGPLFAPAGPFDGGETPADRIVRAVGEAIWKHQGRGSTVTIAELMQRTGVGTERGVKAIVETLVMQYGMLIGGSRERDGMGGYFVIRDEEDFKLAVGPYQAQIETMSARLERLKRMAIERGVLKV
jgi:hypothetical protein